MRLRAFLYTDWPFVCFPLGSVCSTLLLLNWLVFLLLILFFTYSRYESSGRYVYFEYFIPILACFFTFSLKAFDEKCLILIKSNLFGVFFPILVSVLYETCFLQIVKVFSQNFLFYQLHLGSFFFIFFPVIPTPFVERLSFPS